MNHNQVYCQVGFHLQGICFGIAMNYSKSKEKINKHNKSEL